MSNQPNDEGYLMASMEWIRKAYGVPAKRGGRIIYTGDGKQEFGTIRSAARSGHLNIQLDGIAHTMPFHPTWCLEYLSWTERDAKASTKSRAI